MHQQTPAGRVQHTDAAGVIQCDVAHPGDPSDRNRARPDAPHCGLPAHSDTSDSLYSPGRPGQRSA
jgi:hypothetical protein